MQQTKTAIYPGAMSHTQYIRTLIFFLFALLTIGHISVPAQVLQLAELNTEQIRALDKEKTIVLIPGGILEQHGPYLPSYTDGYRNEWATRELAQAIAARPGWTALVFPTIPLGVGGANEIGGIFSFPGTYAVRSTTLLAVFVDLAVELGEQGFKWIFVVHLHGAPAHSRVLDEAGDYFRDMYGGRMVHLYGLLPVLEAGSQPLDPAEAAGSGLDIHAGRGETSDILFIRPDLVDPGYQTAPPLPGLSFDDLVRIAQSPDWPGYFSAPGQATAAEGKARLEQRTGVAAGLMWQIVDRTADEREIPRYAMTRSGVQQETARAAAAEERNREKRFAEWLAKQGESSDQFRNEKRSDNSGDEGCLTETTLSERLQFAGIDRAREILGRSDEWARQLSAFERGVRMRTTEPTNIRDFLDFISGAADAWTDDEQRYWQSLIDQLSEAMEGMNVNIPDAWMVKSTGLEEFNAVYVRNQSIIFPRGRIDIAGDVPRDFFLLAHEVFHLLSLENPSRRDELYTLLGLRQFPGLEYPVELEGRRLSNPIYGSRYEYALRVQTDSGPVYVTPVYQAAVPLEEFIAISEGGLRVVFEAVDFVLLPVDTGTRAVLRDDSGKPVVYTFEDTDWIEQMQRNSSYIIHPDEQMAENFALLMEWRRSGSVPETVPGGPGEGFPVNDIGLLTEIEKVLTAGCEE
jgi:creatinine amidohydrolase/Fe(II)-dependent formamide hydrolase-like protein